LLEEFPDPVFVLLNVRIELGVGALEISISHDSGPAVTWSRDVDHIQVVLLDDSVEMDVDEIEPGSRAPMSQEAGFHMLNSQEFTKQRILQEIDLANRKIVRGTPVAIDLSYLIRRKWLLRRRQRSFHGS
jgi:hypothetical protein